MLAIADDISGAAEVAMGLESRTTRTVLVLGDRLPRQDEPSEVPVFDLDTRQLEPAVAAERVADVACRYDSSVLLKKIDSMLRGNVAAETQAVRRSGHGVVIAPARPTAGRSAIDGVIRVDGVPLHETGSWRVEGISPPATVAEAFGSLATRVVDLRVVRGDRTALVAALRTAVVRGVSPICDAATEADLDRVVDAAMDLPDLGLVGSAGIADALGRFLASNGGDAATRRPAEPATGPRRLLVVVGTAAPEARTQLEHLISSGVVAAPVRVGVDQPALTDGELPSRIGHELARGPAVVTLDSAAGVLPERAREIAKALATLVSRIPGIGECDLVLTGGETARRVLEAQGVDVLWPVREIHPGAVQSRTENGRAVVTRPGSFGGIASLTRIIRDWETGRWRRH